MSLAKILNIYYDSSYCYGAALKNCINLIYSDSSNLLSKELFYLKVKLGYLEFFQTSSPMFDTLFGLPKNLQNVVYF